MFLIRTAFWLAVVVLFLPTGQPVVSGSGDEAPVAQISMWQAVGAARVTASDMANFCDRNLEVCETGNTAWRVFSSKAKYGAQMVYGWFSGRAAANASTPAGRSIEVGQSRAGAKRTDRAVNPAIMQNTLTLDDLTPIWRGPQAGRV